jgi:hypothetical protein
MSPGDGARGVFFRVLRVDFGIRWRRSVRLPISEFHVEWETAEQDIFHGLVVSLDALFVGRRTSPFGAVWTWPPPNRAE